MNYNFYKLYGFLSFFPIWVFRVNLSINDILILSLLFLFGPIFIHAQLFKLYFKTKTKIIYFWLSCVTFYCIDQNLSLWVPTKNANLIINFNSPYLNSLLFSIISIILLYLLFLFMKEKALNFFSLFCLLSLLLIFLILRKIIQIFQI